MFFLKSKGTNIVADFVQIRDNNLVLIEQIKVSALDKKLKNIFPDKTEKIIEQIKNAQFETIVKISL